MLDDKVSLHAKKRGMSQENFINYYSNGPIRVRDYKSTQFKTKEEYFNEKFHPEDKSWPIRNQWINSNVENQAAKKI